MAYRLGIDVGEALTLAAYLADGEVRLLPLVDGAAAVSTIAHVASDGGVTVGPLAKEAAASEPAGLINDPLNLLVRKSQTEVNGQRITGEILATRLLELVLAKAVAGFGKRPERTVVAHPAHWSGDSTTNLMAAAERAGLPNVTLVPADEASIIATTIAGESSGIANSYLGAYGAAVLASKAIDDGLELTQPVPMPLVTKEDIEGPMPELARREPVIESIYEPEGPATVFTEEAEEEVVPTPAPAPIREPLPAPFVSPEPPRRTGWYAAIGTVAFAVLAAGAYLLFFVDDQASDTTTTPASSVVATAAPTSTSTAPTTTASTTTVPPATTVPPTTLPPTTVPPATVPPTTVPPTTIPELARPGVVALSGSGLILQPGTGAEVNVPFGFDADVALERIVAVAGAPDVDSGWINDEFCSAPEVRIIQIGDLEAIFAGESGDGAGRRTFEQWFVSGDDGGRPENLVARRGAGVGVSLAAMSAIYGDAFSSQSGVSGDGSGFFQLEADGPISGTTSGLEPDDTILNLSAGLTCTLAE